MDCSDDIGSNEQRCVKENARKVGIRLNAKNEKRWEHWDNKAHIVTDKRHKKPNGDKEKWRLLWGKC